MVSGGWVDSELVCYCCGDREMFDRRSYQSKALAIAVVAFVRRLMIAFITISVNWKIAQCSHYSAIDRSPQ